MAKCWEKVSRHHYYIELSIHFTHMSIVQLHRLAAVVRNVFADAPHLILQSL